jgi:hypothetical protein
LRPFHWLPIPIVVMELVLILIVRASKGGSAMILPLASVLALGISVEIGGRMGFLVSPRYQVPLFGALFFAMATAKTIAPRLGVTLLAVLELGVLAQMTIPDIVDKSNGKRIAETIERATPRDRTAVIVQHELRLGYPDPLHNFVLHFYLDELHPGAVPYRLFELPRLKEVTAQEGVQGYFGGGSALKAEFAAMPIGEWSRWLAMAPYDRVWFVAAEPAIGLERRQMERFLGTVTNSNFVEDRRHGETMGGYPTTRLFLFIRRNRR